MESRASRSWFVGTDCGRYGCPGIQQFRVLSGQAAHALFRHQVRRAEVAPPVQGHWSHNDTWENGQRNTDHGIGRSL